MPQLPRPAAGVPVPQLIADLAHLLGTHDFVVLCTELMGGADRHDHVAELRYLTGHPIDAGSPVLDPDVWGDYWVRTWGARGLLHVWTDEATSAIVAGLADEHWRPAEMCLKVTARHEVAGAGAGAAALAPHELPRVRGQALRALAVVGDVEHVEVVRERVEDPDADVRRQAARALDALARRLDLSR